jgi:predicted nucleotidyltransferase
MKTKNIKQKIKEYFFINPLEKLRVRQIERTLNVPLPSVIKYAKELEKEEILQIIEISKVKFYAANRDSKKFLLEKMLFNIKSLLDSGLLKHLIKEFGNPTIVLFGSYSRGEDIESSDIDIYIESASKLKINLEKFQKILKRKIQLFIQSNIKKIPNPYLANNIINGIKLNGFVEVFK